MGGGRQNERLSWNSIGSKHTDIKSIRLLCELAGGYDIPLPCFAGHGIPKRCKEFDECVEKGTKPDWCPFVCSLPEGHGRLIDASSKIIVPMGENGELHEMKIDSLLDYVTPFIESAVPADTAEGGTK